MSFNELTQIETKLHKYFNNEIKLTNEEANQFLLNIHDFFHKFYKKINVQKQLSNIPIQGKLDIQYEILCKKELTYHQYIKENKVKNFIDSIELHQYAKDDCKFLYKIVDILTDMKISLSKKYSMENILNELGETFVFTDEDKNEIYRKAKQDQYCM